MSWQKQSITNEMKALWQLSGLPLFSTIETAQKGHQGFAFINLPKAKMRPFRLL
jgi:hypothetical protein